VAVGLTPDAFVVQLGDGGGDRFHQSQPPWNMNFWTPERCKTIDTLVLMDNSCEMSMQAELTKSAIRKARLLENVQMIQAELRSRV